MLKIDRPMYLLPSQYRILCNQMDLTFCRLAALGDCLHGDDDAQSQTICQQDSRASNMKVR